MEPNTNTNEQSQSLVPAYDPKSAYWDGSHKDHAAAVAAVREKFQARYDGVAPGNPRTVDLDGKPVEITFNAGLLADLEARQAGRDPANTPKPYALDPPAFMPVGEKLEADAINSYAEVARVNGIEKETAQELLHTWGSLSEDAPSDGWNEENGMAAIKREWGLNTHDHIERIQKFVSSKPKLAAWLDETGAGSDPAMLAILHVLARQADGTLGAYRKEIDAAYLSASDPRHREAVNAVKVMYAIKRG